jgi:PAS domain-containing protein
MCQMLGYEHEELTLLKISDIDTELTNIEKLKQTILRHKANGGCTFEARHKRKDERIIDVLVSSTYLDIDPGYFFCFHAISPNRKEFSCD